MRAPPAISSIQHFNVKAVGQVTLRFRHGADIGDWHDIPMLTSDEMHQLCDLTGLELETAYEVKPMTSTY
ncbi:MAG: hypothetical protein JSV90_06530 [Methanobacteriota archaeon]|nr:MAG: hypothetical protein JSV90_06530 [Euryarchaeota archaeon]